MSEQQLQALVSGQITDPFGFLGLHRQGKQRVVRCFFPGATSCELLASDGKSLGVMERVHAEGVFVGQLPSRRRVYKFGVSYEMGQRLVVDDPYRFDTTLSDLDRYLLGEGSDDQIHKKLGAHVKKMQGVSGVRFAVWAPNARRVSVVGNFNQWDGRRHVMRLHPGNGIWEIFVPGLGSGDLYKFELLDQSGGLLPLKTDPFANYHEPAPASASVVYESEYRWQDQEWMQRRRGDLGLDKPLSVYEVHLGSWRRNSDGDALSYREFAEQLVDYVVDMGFTHIELMPVTEHPFDGSWGYQPIGMYAPTCRFGTPDELRLLIDYCHRAEIGVIVDWVPAHFPRDEHGLARFDGTALYEHEDPRKGAHQDWGTLIFNYGRREVVNYLLGSALYWVDEFHIDGIRVDAVASMLYLDYSRSEGEWIPNEDGGNENYEAVTFLRRLNTVLHAHGATSFAEESTAWPGVSKPVDVGGLGFTYKWNMGWMNDTLQYMKEDPIHRKYHHDKMTFGLVYAFNENFVLPLSHDEVVHGKGSLLGRMPGDDWQRFANLRAYLASMFAHPGKKLLFMGGEFAQSQEWSHERSLDWHLLEFESHGGVQKLVRDLNHAYRAIPALHEVDYSSEGFEWIDYTDHEQSVLAWLRSDKNGGFVISVSNFTPVLREGYRLGLPRLCRLQEILNTDDKAYWGSGVVNNEITVEAHEHLTKPASALITLPPLATVFFTAMD